MKCYLFDIDGTLADGEHRIHHIKQEKKDWRAYFAACAGDKPIQHMVDLAITLYDADHKIIYVSGRSDECMEATIQWLIRHQLPDAPLFMRKAGDHRNDDILKSEFLDQIIAAGYEPIMAFDDRDRVVKMWRERGIPCCQVAPGDF